MGNLNESRFAINLYDIKGIDYPVNTYFTDDIESVLVFLRDLFDNNMSGIGRIEILDNYFGTNKTNEEKRSFGQCPMRI